MIHRITLATVTLLTVAATSQADVKLPAIFSDHAVLQADVTVPVWGWAEPGEAVKVSLGDATESTKADADSKWSVKLPKLKTSSTPQELIVTGKNKLAVKDVLVGQVWIASGQSNMAFQVQRGMNAAEEISAANYPELRMFTVKGNPQRKPQQDCVGKWEVCKPETVPGFSAVAYFFGRALHKELGVPVGMINSSVGGTDIAAWIDEPAQLKDAGMKARIDVWAENDKNYSPEKAQATLEKQMMAWKPAVEKAKAAGKNPLPPKPKLAVKPATDSNYPANLYNGMIAPLVPYAVKGAIWYQGEHNCSNLLMAELYYRYLPLLVKEWRNDFGKDLAFGWVQLPQLDRPSYRPVVRDAMLAGTRTIKNTGMAVTIDIGMPNDNHPVNKQDVGKRLAMWALGDVYGQKVPSTSGPLLEGHSIQGREIVVAFSHADGGLECKTGELKGFEIAGEDQKWMPAKARIEGKNVVVSSSDVPKPAAVRYAWADNPTASLFNGAGLPASPFRTDDWPLKPLK